MNKNRVSALFFLVFSCLYGLMAGQIAVPFASDDAVFSPRTVPEALAVAGVVLSLAMIARPGDRQVERPGLKAAFSGLQWKPVVFLTVLMVLYGFALEQIGFLLSTIAFLLGGFWILGERNWKVLLLASVPMVVCFWFLLTQVLGVYLSPGDLFEAIEFG